MPYECLVSVGHLCLDVERKILKDGLFVALINVGEVERAAMAGRNLSLLGRG